MQLISSASLFIVLAAAVAISGTSAHGSPSRIPTRRSSSNLRGSGAGGTSSARGMTPPRQLSDTPSLIPRLASSDSLRREASEGFRGQRGRQDLSRPASSPALARTGELSRHSSLPTYRRRGSSHSLNRPSSNEASLRHVASNPNVARSFFTSPRRRGSSQLAPGNTRPPTYQAATVEEDPYEYGGAYISRRDQTIMGRDIPRTLSPTDISMHPATPGSPLFGLSSHRSRLRASGSNARAVLNVQHTLSSGSDSSAGEGPSNPRASPPPTQRGFRQNVISPIAGHGSDEMQHFLRNALGDMNQAIVGEENELADDEGYLSGSPPPPQHHHHA